MQVCVCCDRRSGQDSSFDELGRLRSHGRCDLAHDELEALPVVGRVGGEQEITRAEFVERQQSLDALLGREEEKSDSSMAASVRARAGVPQGGLVLGEDRAEGERLADLGGVAANVLTVARQHVELVAEGFDLVEAGVPHVGVLGDDPQVRFSPAPPIISGNRAWSGFGSSCASSSR